MTEEQATERTVATKRDLVEQNVDKVFGNGFAADKTEQQEASEATALVERARAQIMPRPEFGVSATEIDAAKMMAMAGPLIPGWLRANPGHCWGIIQLSKRWTRFDQRTNSWIHFDPITIAQASYFVSSKENPDGAIAYMSVFIRALVEAFAPMQTRMRFTYAGEGQDRVCICSAVLRGELKPHEYQTPPLKLITPKRSPLWQSDPDRQLAYYASRAWARLYCAAVLQGVYDEDELEGAQRVEPAKQVTTGSAEALHLRLAQAKAQADPLAEGEGFRDGSAEKELKRTEAGATEKPAHAKKARGGYRPKGRKAKRVESARSAGNDAPNEQETGEGISPQPGGAVLVENGVIASEGEKPKPTKQPEPPKNLNQYRQHVRTWLITCKSEEAIEHRWRSEMSLRNRCGVTAEEKATIRADYVEQRIAELSQ